MVSATKKPSVLLIVIIISGGSSLRSWQLTHELTSLQKGVNTIDDDLTYLYGQLPDKIRNAAVDVMTKKMRRVITDISVAALNFFGYFFT